MSIFEEYGAFNVNKSKRITKAWKTKEESKCNMSPNLSEARDTKLLKLGPRTLLKMYKYIISEYTSYTD